MKVNSIFDNITRLPLKIKNRLSVLSVVKYSNFESPVFIGNFTKFYSSSMNSNSYVGSQNLIVNTEIGRFCSIGSGCMFGLAKHPIHFLSTSPVFLSGKNSLRKNFCEVNFSPFDDRIIIGNDVWIGNNVIILQGRKISDGAVIGAGAVVTHDVGPYEIWGGNPARMIKKRFDETTIDDLLSLKWWEFSEEKLTAISKYIDDVPLFIKENCK